jgi:exopolyphosphatase/guanosine-5'-triphosphate,3'-diphosphate pyrophosphatase
MTTSIAAPSRILAGVDIGTLTCRLLIAELSCNGHLLKEVRSDRRILRLGQDVDRDGILRADAMDRVIATLKEWRQLIDHCRADATAAVATSAVRDASNREEFLCRVKRETGFEVELISGEEEARRTLLGIRSGLPPGVEHMLAVDIGGGSTEFIVDRPGLPQIICSIDIGVVRFSERVLHHDPPTAGEVEYGREWVRKEMVGAVRGMSCPREITFVGTAGTITSLAAMAQQLPVYEPVRIHNYTLTLEAVRRLEQQLLSRSSAQRIGMPGLERGREEVIVAGVVILSTIMDALQRDEILVNDYGLREGVLIDLANRMGITEAVLFRIP